MTSTMNRVSTDGRAPNLRGRLLPLLLTASLVAASGEAVRAAEAKAVERQGREREAAERLERDLAAARSEIEAERNRWEALFDNAPLPYVLTDPSGTIRDVNAAGANLLAVSRRFLSGKVLTVFVDGGRSEFQQEMIRAAEAQHEPVRVSFVLRPRERAPILVGATVHRFSLPDGIPGLWWVFEPAASTADQG